MDLSELSSFLDPLVEEEGDYAKGNEFTPEMIEKDSQRYTLKLEYLVIRSFLFSRKLVLVFIVLKMLLMDIRLLTKEALTL